MNIIWNQNPLTTQVELNETEIKLLKALYEKEILEYDLFDVYYELKNCNYDEALKKCRLNDDSYRKKE